MLAMEIAASVLMPMHVYSTGMTAETAAAGRQDRAAQDRRFARSLRGGCGNWLSVIDEAEIHGSMRCTDPCPRIRNLDGIARPAYEKTDLSRYNGIGMLTST